jgi:MFS family permease
MFPPVLLVLILSLPIITVSLWDDFDDARDLASETVGSTSFFEGTSGGNSKSITIIPDKVIEENFEDTTERVNLTNTTGQDQEIEQKTPWGSILEATLNALLMIIVAALAGFGIYFLFKYKRRHTLKAFFALALGLCSSLSVMIYLYFSSLFMDNYLGVEVPFSYAYYSGIAIVGFLAGGTISFNMVFRSLQPKKKNPALIAFCVILGPFLAIVLPVWLVIFLLIGISLWDLWAAKRGIIKEMVNLSEEHKKEELAMEATSDPSPITASVSSREQGSADQKDPVRKRKKFFTVEKGEDITTYGLYEGKHYSLGIGDFIFFSLLASASFTWFMLKIPWMGFYVSILGEVLAVAMTAVVIAAILLGLKHTLGFLEKDNVMPGLPISILWGLIAFIVCAGSLEVVNLIFYGGVVNPF